MSAENYYDDRADRLASEQHCLTENENDREASEEEVAAAIEQEQILEASRSVRAGVDMLFAAMRKARVL